jgi:hypothetical protein
MGRILFYFYNFLPVMPKIYPPGVTRRKEEEKEERKR